MKPPASRYTLPMIALVAFVTGCRSTSNLKVVSPFDPERYLGVWYEAARYPHRFEKGMSSVSAAYSRRPDGTLKVVNRGYHDEKKVWKSIEGTAKPRGAADHGWLKVSFFWPFYGSYKIVYLDSAYTQAIVTSSTFDYFWILVRDPAIPRTELEALIVRAEQLGFDRSKMIIVDQTRRFPQRE